MHNVKNLSIADTNFFSKILDSSTKNSIDFSLYSFLMDNNVSNKELSSILSNIKSLGCKHPKQIMKVVNIRKGINKELVKLNDPDILLKCIEKYDVILKKIKILVNELPINDSLNLSFLFTFMLRKGYFSITKTNKYDLNNLRLIDNYYSFDVFGGRGRCINFTDFLVDILNYCGYNSAPIVNYLPSNMKSNMEYLILKNIPLRGSNHVAALIVDNNKPYIFDPTNCTVFRIKNDKKATNQINNENIYLDKLHSLAFLDTERRRETFKRFCSLSKFSSPYDKHYIKLSYYYQLEDIAHNGQLLEDFYSDTLGQINDVNEMSKKLIRTRY